MCAERAEELLLKRRVPIGEVSYLLGCAEPTNFHRAFRRWTGWTPAECASGSSGEGILAETNSSADRVVVSAARLERLVM